MKGSSLKLPENLIAINKPQELLDLLLTQSNISHKVYWPEKLASASPSERLKISNKTFKNFSFSNTEILNVDFTDCHFENVLFKRTSIEGCDFQRCTFKRVNTHKITISRTYINPQNFVKNYVYIEESNMAVHLFQQLLNNSKDNEQNEFARVANYNFHKWKGILAKNKYLNKRPYSIGWGEYFTTYYLNIVYRFTFGYGLRLRNFILSFAVVFLLSFITNCLFWQDYKLLCKDINIDAFDASSANFSANFFYTVDCTTKIIDSQFQPSSNLGMFIAIAEGGLSLVCFTFLITILQNKYVK